MYMFGHSNVFLNLHNQEGAAGKGRKTNYSGGSFYTTVRPCFLFFFCSHKVLSNNWKYIWEKYTRENFKKAKRLNRGKYYFCYFLYQDILSALTQNSIYTIKFWIFCYVYIWIIWFPDVIYIKLIGFFSGCSFCSKF